MDKDKVLVDVIEYFNRIKGSPAIFNYFESSFMVFKMKNIDHDGTRTHNLPIRSRTPYPLGHAAGRSRFNSIGTSTNKYTAYLVSGPVLNNQID